MAPRDYTNVQDFGWALRHLKDGKKVARREWNGGFPVYLELQIPDEHSKMQRPYIYIIPVDKELVPWVASQNDLLAEDWLVFD